MLSFKGKFGEAIVYSDIMDEASISQLYEILETRQVENESVRIMPDNHCGSGCLIGYTQTYSGGWLNPDSLGCDLNCLDKDTEILTLNGWVKLSDYDSINLPSILVYDVNKEIAFFDKPVKYIKEKCNEFYHIFKKGCGLDQVVSEDHGLLVYKGYKKEGRKFFGRKINVNELISLKDINRNYYTFPAAFNLDDNSLGIDLTDDMIRLDAMIQADGHVEYRYTLNKNYVEMHFTKERKINRCRRLLQRNNIEFKEKIYKDGSTCFSFHIQKDINKDLQKYYNANKHQLFILQDEAMKWGGHIGYRTYYSSCNKENANVIQYALAANNIRGFLYTSDKNQQRDSKHSLSYQVGITRNKFVGYCNNVKKIPSVDGYKYCFQTNTGYFVARRNDNIFVTGNCGMLATKYELGEQKITLEEFDRAIRKIIPMGMNINEKWERSKEKDFKKFLKNRLEKFRSLWPEMIKYEGLGNIEQFITQFCRRIGLDEGIWWKSLGTLGGGESIR